ncbi:permease [Anaeroselena agilis]|uniref:Permease n=1 Tax=Anaeroselena agilis TaxID=3063788 RepID=A0ABU3NY07_9FIRM|nr:permease [Selenomonadales bacterium 4137-cl]
MFEYFADLVVYRWLGLAPESPLTAALHFFVYDTPKIFLLLAVAIYVITVIRSYFPPEKTKKFLSRRHTFVGNILAALIGIMTPFCSCSAVPLFIGFIEAGVPLGVTFSFLISSPMVNEIALVLLLGMFGWQVALIYAVTGVTIAVIAGYVIGKLQLEHLVEEYVYQIKSGETEIYEPTFAERCQAAGDFTLDLLKKIGPYIIAALAVGGIIHGYVPDAFIVKYAGRDNPLAVPLVVLLGVPLYNSSSGMVPIIYALIEKGLPLGTSLAFMMAVSAISLPEMIILRRVLKPKLIAVFAGILAVSVILTGYLFNALV